MKKLLLILLLVFVFLFFIIGGFFLYNHYTTIQMNKALNDMAPVLGESLELLRAGMYEDGIAKCNELKFGNAQCYYNYISLKITNNQSIDSEICEGITIGNLPEYPLEGEALKNFKKNLIDYTEKTRQSCFDAAS